MEGLSNSSMIFLELLPVSRKTADLLPEFINLANISYYITLELLLNTIII